MCAWIDAEELAVKHQRKPRERMPIGSETGRKRPPDGFFRKPFHHVRIFVDVILVIEVCVFELAGRPIDRERHERECERNSPGIGTVRLISHTGETYSDNAAPSART